MKIQYQLWLIFSGLFILVSLAVYSVVSNMYEQRLQLGSEQLSMTQVSTVVEQVKGTYPHSANRSIGYLKTYSEQQNSRLIILDDNKRVFADSFEQLEQNTSLNLAILAENNVPSSVFSKTGNFGYVQYTLLPFQSFGDKGYLLMIQEANELYDELKSFQNWMVQTLLISVVVFFFIAYIVSNWFSKPIRQVIFQLKKITPQKRTFSLKYKRRDEMKELIDAIQNMVEQLNLYDERQRRFLSSSSHELKTPLATMQLILENLPYVREDEDTYQEFAEDLSYQVNKMKQMVEQLLQMNRLWETPLKIEALHSNEIGKHIQQSFQYIAKHKQITLNFDVEPTILYVDQKLFLHGLDNVISNAIRYSPQGQYVEIHIKNEKQQITISVCDKGIGISEKDLSHIFEPFYRSNDATEWNQEGSGLGLAIVKQMVELHKGRISVDSVKDQGTCLHIFLPKS